MAAVDVVADGDIHGGEAGHAFLHLLGQENQSGAGAEEWQSVQDAAPQGLQQFQVMEELPHDDGFPALEKQSVKGPVQQREGLLQSFSQILGAADEGHLELRLVNVICIVSGRETFALIDVVDLNGLQEPDLHEVADTHLAMTEMDTVS